MRLLPLIGRHFRKMPVEDYTLREENDCLVVQIELDNLLGVIEVSRIGEKLNDLMQDRPLKLILDVGAVRYAGSAALGMLLSLSKDLRDRGGRMILACTDHIDNLLRVSRTLAVFEVAPDVDSAIHMLSTPAR